jgi:hypothetical protein
MALEYVGAFLEPNNCQNPCASSAGWPLSSSIHTFSEAPTRYLEFERRKLGRDALDRKLKTSSSLVVLIALDPSYRRHRRDLYGPRLLPLRPLHPP